MWRPLWRGSARLNCSYGREAFGTGGTERRFLDRQTGRPVAELARQRSDGRPIAMAALAYVRSRPDRQLSTHTRHLSRFRPIRMGERLLSSDGEIARNDQIGRRADRLNLAGVGRKLPVRSGAHVRPMLPLR